MVCLACADARKLAFNLPEVDLPGDQQLVADLRAAATRKDLQDFIKEWRWEGLPAKLALLQQQPASGAVEPRQAGAPAPRDSRMGSEQAHPQQQVQADTAAPPVEGQYQKQVEQATKPSSYMFSKPTHQQGRNPA